MGIGDKISGRVKRPGPQDPLIFRLVTHDDLGCASYLIGDVDAGVAASLVARFGASEVVHVVDGGVGTWGELCHPPERP